jgi:hypothetical protein
MNQTNTFSESNKFKQQELDSGNLTESSEDCKKMCDFLDNVDVEGCTWGVWSKGTVVHEKKCVIDKYPGGPRCDKFCHSIRAVHGLWSKELMNNQSSSPTSINAGTKLHLDII